MPWRGRWVRRSPAHDINLSPTRFWPAIVSLSHSGLSEAVMVVTTPPTASPTHTRIARSTGRQDGGSFRVHALPIRPASHVLNVTPQLTGMPLLFFAPYRDPYFTLAVDGTEEQNVVRRSLRHMMHLSPRK
ncbi:hypothetical protein B296_00045247 [Ensete ventricosum]|uniref:Uncharacterized protein n=1 Tax=Ensete ventricosum TaxID=4639 RepID=A0A426XCV0_ENSVE|nr:hypothetical protein B296_00045247 [Ensete ventricosum]